jgi:hypothetical protein
MARLPKALLQELETTLVAVVIDYRDFVERGLGAHRDDAKGFAGHHSAARTSLGHLELLLRVARLCAGGDDPRLVEGAAILEQCRTTLRLEGSPETEELHADDDADPG